jgi:pantoate--beta-alanine ligase
MDIIQTVDAMQQFARERQRMGDRLALVPTMGALHEGHLSLVDIAQQHADTVIVSVFVNPTQFAPEEDFDEYPRDLEGDAETLRSRNVNIVFAPSASEMYPHSDDPVRTAPLAWVTVDDLDDVLCGRERDQHFRGVTTVVTKLFHACSPDVAVFGQKDAQQLAIIRRMVDELLFDIDIVAGPIVREDDGLAMSSRNAYLNDHERAQATVLSNAVSEAEAQIQAGEQEVEAVVRAMQKALADAPLGDVEYVNIVDADRLTPLETLEPGQRVLAAVAVHFGDTRLIDNAITRVPDAA